MTYAPGLQSAGIGTNSQAQRSDSPRRWSSWQRVLFRFTASYLMLYLSYALVAYAAVPVPVLGAVITSLWNGFTDRVGTTLLHFSAEDMARVPSDAGDVLAGFVFVFCVFSLAVAATVAWSVLDRRRQEYDNLHGWVRLIVRYALFYILFDYGIGKVFPLQFSPPDPLTLLRRYGEFTRFDVLWEFMGVSQPYTIFCGIVEVVGALLLVRRRTTTLGALICSAALVNVVVLNFAYDINVKLYSLHLLLMAAFLLAPEIKPLMQLLVFRERATPADLPSPMFVSRWATLGAKAVWTVFVGMVLYSQITTSWGYFRQKYLLPEPLPMYGAYEVETFVRNGQEVPRSAMDKARWDNVAIQSRLGATGSGSLYVRQMEGYPTRTFQFRLDLKHDPAKKEFFLTRAGGRDPRTLTYIIPDSDHLELSGTLQQGIVQMRLRKIDLSQFRLPKQRLHLVQPNALGKPDWAR